MPKTDDHTTPKLTLVDAAPSLPQAKGVNLQLFRDVAEAFGVLEEFDRRVGQGWVRAAEESARSHGTVSRRSARAPSLRLIQGGAA